MQRKLGSSKGPPFRRRAGGEGGSRIRAVFQGSTRSIGGGGESFSYGIRFLGGVRGCNRKGPGKSVRIEHLHQLENRSGVRGTKNHPIPREVTLHGAGESVSILFHVKGGACQEDSGTQNQTYAQTTESIGEFLHLITPEGSPTKGDPLNFIIAYLRRRNETRTSAAPREVQAGEAGGRIPDDVHWESRAT